MNLISVTEGTKGMSTKFLWELNGKYVLTCHTLLLDISTGFSFGWSNLSGKMEVKSYLADSQGRILASIDVAGIEAASDFEQAHERYASNAFSKLGLI